MSYLETRWKQRDNSRNVGSYAAKELLVMKELLSSKKFAFSQ